MRQAFSGAVGWMVVLVGSALEVPAAWGQSAALETVTVTANKYPQALDQYAGQVSVIAAPELTAQHILSIDDLDRAVPGLTIRPRGARVYDSLTLRGQSSVDFYNPTVQVYVDGLPQDQATFGQLLPDDLERVELLHGPQGTLYGRDAVGGVLSLITHKPEETFSAAGTGFYADQGLGASARLGGGLAPGLSADIAGGYQKDDGQYRAATGQSIGDTKDETARVRLRYAPVGGPWDVLAMAGWEDIRSDEEQYVLEPERTARLAYPLPAGYHLMVNRFGVTAAYHLEDATVTSLSGYQDRVLNRTVFGTESPEAQRTFTQELRIASNPGPLRRIDYVGGIAYEHTDFAFDRPQYGQTSDQQLRSAAVFGELTGHLTDAFDLTGGARFDDHRAAAQASGGGALSASDTFTKFSPKVSVGYQWLPQVRLYALYSTGFKAGGFTHLATPANVSFAYAPETAHNFEVGAHASFLEQRMHLSAAAYLTDSNDYQLYVGVQPNQYLQNVGKVRSKGLELNLDFAPLERLHLTAGLDFNSARFTEYQDPFHSGQDFTGNRLPFAPRFSGRAGASYRFALPGEWGELTPWMGGKYVSTVFFDQTNTLGESGYALFDASVSWTPLHGHYGVEAYMEDLGDKLYSTYGFSGGPGFNLDQLGRRREAGLRVHAAL